MTLGDLKKQYSSDYDDCEIIVEYDGEFQSAEFRLFLRSEAEKYLSRSDYSETSSVVVLLHQC